jgi:hypothetical protein
MTKDLKLTIELVPSSAWFNNLRMLLKPYMWDRIRKKVYTKYDYKCGICGAGGKLDCHEVWEYDDKKKIQKLTNLIALCQNCHNVKHIGLSELRGSNGEVDMDKLIKHFMDVNDCGRSTFLEHKRKAYEVWEERSRHEWNLDLRDCNNHLLKQ